MYDYIHYCLIYNSIKTENNTNFYQHNRSRVDELFPKVLSSEYFRECKPQTLVIIIQNISCMTERKKYPPYINKITYPKSNKNFMHRSLLTPVPNEVSNFMVTLSSGKLPSSEDE